MQRMRWIILLNWIIFSIEVYYVVIIYFQNLDNRYIIKDSTIHERDDFLVDENLLKDIKFVVELDKMKTILRQTSIIGDERREDDAQHSWHISIMAMILSEYSNEEIDVFKTIKMLLIHDLVELHAGDTFCFDKEGNKGKREREEEAIDIISKSLSGAKGMEIKILWTEFEDMETKEAIFAASMDRLQPMLNNYNNKGGTWKKFNISKKDVYKRIEPVKYSSDKLWEFAKLMIEDAHEKGFITKE